MVQEDEGDEVADHAGGVCEAGRVHVRGGSHQVRGEGWRGAGEERAVKHRAWI